MAEIHSLFEPDLRRIQNFLMGVDGVYRACLYMSQGELFAHVTLCEDCRITPSDLQDLCAENLGVYQTPSRVLADFISGTPQFGQLRMAA